MSDLAAPPAHGGAAMSAAPGNNRFRVVDPDPDQVAHAKVIIRLALGRPVAEKTQLALPTKPFDWSGLANTLASTPDITRRAALVKSWLASQTHLPTEAAGLLRRTFHQAEAEPLDEDPADDEEAGAG